MAPDSENLVSIPVGDVELEGMLAVSEGAPGLVVFAHGGGSSRKSPRNNFVAEVIRERNLGTLLFDLLTEEVDAVVSRGGRVDLAEESLADVQAPTRFIVGGADTRVLELNREAYDVLSVEKDPHVVEGAGHLFEGEGELEEVADVAADWFAETLG